MDVTNIPKSTCVPQGMLGASLTALMSASSRTPSSTATAFIPAKKFEGTKRGYVFTKGDKGLGYSTGVITEEECLTGTIWIDQEMLRLICPKRNQSVLRSY